MSYLFCERKLLKDSIDHFVFEFSKDLPWPCQNLVMCRLWIVGKMVRILMCTRKVSFQEVAVVDVKADMFVTLCAVCHVFRHRLSLFINSYVLCRQNNWVISETLLHSREYLAYWRKEIFHSMLISFLSFVFEPSIIWNLSANCSHFLMSKYISQRFPSIFPNI